MAVTSTLATLGRLIGRKPPPPADILEAYAHEVIPVLDRAEWLYQYWLEQSTLFTDSEKLGNVAAIHRWETATMGRSLERVIPPSVLARAHEAVIDALELASRAAQLLSSGSRFHNANAVCEGHAMLATSRDRRLVALRAMRRYLLNIPTADQQEIHDESVRAEDAASVPAALDGQDLHPGQDLQLEMSATELGEIPAMPAADEPDGADALDGADEPDGVPAFLPESLPSFLPPETPTTQPPQPIIGQSPPAGPAPGPASRPAARPDRPRLHPGIGRHQ